jgi:ubiquinone/menaquinone biosynthesis methyltransferase
MTPPSGAAKAQFVRRMFDAIASRYDLMNRLMTAGRDGAWRALAIDSVHPEAVRVGLDVGAGTGDLALALARQARGSRVIAMDFSSEMLRLGARKASRSGLAGVVQPVLGDATGLPIRDQSMDAVVTGFTLRNVADLRSALAEARRVLRPGGRICVLELTHPQLPVFRSLFRLYFHRLVPLLGSLIAGARYAYEYLPASVDTFPVAGQLRDQMSEAGFSNVSYRLAALGTVALHVAERSAGPSIMSAPAPQPALTVREVFDAVEWDRIVGSLPNAHLMQSWEWGELRRGTGWAPRRLLFERGGRVVAAAAVIRRSTWFGPWGVSYCPKGPALDYGDTPLLRQVLTILAEDARTRRSIALKVDPDVETRERAAIAAFRASGYRPAAEQLQASSTVLNDLRAADDELLRRMSATWRRYVRKSAREGVRVRLGTAADLARFYELHRETAERDQFIPRPLSYYERAFRLLSPRGLIALLIASVAGRDEAAIVVARFGTRGWYLYGATSAMAQRAHAMYLLQWEAMRWAREQGCVSYDMWGAADDPADAGDPLHGVTYLKLGFGGRHVRWVGVYDFVASPALFRLWTIVLPLVRAAYRRLRGERAAAARPPPVRER